MYFQMCVCMCLRVGEFIYLLLGLVVTPQAVQICCCHLTLDFHTTGVQQQQQQQLLLLSFQ